MGCDSGDGVSPLPLLLSSIDYNAGMVVRAPTAILHHKVESMVGTHSTVEEAASLESWSSQSHRNKPRLDTDLIHTRPIPDVVEAIASVFPEH